MIALLITIYINKYVYVLFLKSNKHLPISYIQDRMHLFKCMVGAFSSVVENPSPEYPYKPTVPVKRYIAEEEHDSDNSDDSEYDYALNVYRYKRIYERVLTDKEVVSELLYDCVSKVVSQHNLKSIKWTCFTVHDTYSEHEYDRTPIQVDMRNWIVKASAHTAAISSE